MRPERFELPAFWFVARRSIQLSYGRILILTAFQQLTAEGAWSSTASFGGLEKNGGEMPALRRALHKLKLFSCSQQRCEPVVKVAGCFLFGWGGIFRRVVYFFQGA